MAADRGAGFTILFALAGKAASLTGDGMLSATPPERESPDHFVYDPGDPVPTMGSATGARDQRPVEARPDVLVYTTTPFQKAMEVTEPISAEIYASSSAVDTDFTAKLVDIWPNGYAQNLTDGIIRARYRDSLEKPEFMNPGADLQVLHRSLGYQQCFPSRPPPEAGNIKQQFPSI